MSDWRMIQVAKDKAFDSTSGTDTIKIPRTHQIGCLYLYVKAINGSSQNAVASGAQQTIEEAITKIELISGGKTFRKMSGEVCRRIDAYETGRHPWEERTQEGSAYQHALFRMPFGLEPYDREVILAAPLLGSLDMLIDYNFTQSATVGFGTTLHYDLYIDALRPEPVEVMKSKLTRVIQQKGSYTSTAGGEKRFDLTVDPDRMLRRVYVQNYEVIEPEGVHIDRLGLYVDNVEYFNMKWTRLQALNAADIGLSWVENMLVESGSTGDVIVTRIPNVKPVLAGDIAAGDARISARDDDSLTITSSAQGDIIYLQLGSEVIPTMAVMDFDRSKDMSSMIPQGVMSLELMLNDILADGAVKYHEESIVRGWL